MAEKAGVRKSRNGIAERAGIATSTVSRLIDGGEDSTTHETVQRVAAALAVDPEVIYRAAGMTDGSRKPWLPPLRESFLLEEVERKALDAIVRALARRGGSDATSEPQEEGASVMQLRAARRGRSAGKARAEADDDEPR